MLLYQINEIIRLDDLAGLGKVHIVTGRDHGGGHFGMMFKILLRYHSKDSLSRIYEVANVAQLSDDIKILKDMALKHVIDGLKKIHEGGHFIFEEDENKKLALAFEQTEDNWAKVLCNVPLHISINGDFKFFAQLILGHNRMSSSWCW